MSGGWEDAREPRDSSDCHRVRMLLSTTLDDAVSPGELAEVDRHLAGCEACREVAAHHRALVGALRSAPLEQPARTVLPGHAIPARRILALSLLVVVLVAAALAGALIANPQNDSGRAPAPPTIAERTDTSGNG